MGLSRVLQVAVILGACAVAAHADTYQFSFSGATTDSFTFDLTSSPTPLSTGLVNFMELTDVSITPFGSTTSSNLDTSIYFSVDESGGGLEFGAYLAFFEGLQLFTGTVDAPTFLTGDFNIEESSVSHGSGFGTLTITDVTPAAAPEPGSLALLGTGVVGFAGVVRRRMS